MIRRWNRTMKVSVAAAALAAALPGGVAPARAALIGQQSQLGYTQVLPDLVLHGALIASSQPGSTWIFVAAKNVGTAWSVPSVTRVKIVKRGVYHGTRYFSTRALAPGESTLWMAFAFDWGPVSDGAYIEMTADVWNAVGELSETNNTLASYVGGG